MDNIKTWTGLSVEESVRMTEDRDKCRRYVHGVATQPSDRGRLKNRAKLYSRFRAKRYTRVLLGSFEFLGRPPACSVSTVSSMHRAPPSLNDVNQSKWQFALKLFAAPTSRRSDGADRCHYKRTDFIRYARTNGVQSTPLLPILLKRSPRLQDKTALRTARLSTVFYGPDTHHSISAVFCTS